MPLKNHLKAANKKLKLKYLPKHFTCFLRPTNKPTIRNLFRAKNRCLFVPLDTTSPDSQTQNKTQTILQINLAGNSKQGTPMTDKLWGQKRCVRKITYLAEITPPGVWKLLINKPVAVPLG